MSSIEEIEFLYNSGLSVELLFQKINNIERLNLDDFLENLDDSIDNKLEYPDFIDKLDEGKMIDKCELVDFLERFGLFYIKDEIVRKITDGAYLLFINRSYEGIYTNLDNLNDKIDKNYFELDSFYVSINHEFNNRKETIIYSHYNEFKVRCSFINNQNDSEDYVYDTGATITNIPYANYINVENFRWNNYPYDEFNLEIRNESLRKDFLLENNKFFKSTSEIFSRNADDQKSPKVIIFYNEGFYLTVNGMRVKVKAFSFPYDHANEIVENDENKILSIFRSKPKEQKSKRLNYKYKLLGMDMINQLNSRIVPIIDGSKLIISECNEMLIDNYLYFNQDKYMCILLKSPIALYYNSDESDINGNFYQIPFGLRDIYYHSKSSCDNFNDKRTVTVRNLQLVILYEINYDIMNLIMQNANIDGYIINHKENNCNFIHIHLKDNLPFISMRTNNREEFDDNILYIHSDIDILNKYKISHWYLDLKFNNLQI